MRVIWTIAALLAVAPLAACRSAERTSSPTIFATSGPQAHRALPSPPAPVVVPARAEPPQVLLEIHALWLREGALRYLVSGASPEAGPWRRLCGPDECEELWRALRSSRVQILRAPSVVCATGEQATLEVSEGPTADPKAWTGLRVVATVDVERAEPGRGRGDLLRLDLDARRRAGPGEAEERATVIDAPLRDGDTLLFVAPTPVRPDGPRFGVLVTLTLIPPPDHGAPLAAAGPNPGGRPSAGAP